MKTLRLRQAVVAAADREAVVARWTTELGLGAPFHDPLVGQFGLCNAVLPVGDTFLEVVSPQVNGGGSPAERHMVRHGGDCGYMAIFQVEDMDDARSHLRECGIRSVLDEDLEDIRCTHVHPSDMGAAIVSFDQAIPEGSWRWGGPTWPSEIRTNVVTGLAGIHLAGPDPDGLLATWSRALAVQPRDDTLALPDGSYVTVGSTPPTAAEHERAVPAGRSEIAGLFGIDLWTANGIEPRSFEVAGVTFRLVPRLTPS